MKNYLRVYLKMLFGFLLWLLPVGVVFGIAAFCISPIFILSPLGEPENLFLVPRISVIVCLGSIMLFSGFFTLTAGTLHIVAVNNSPYSNVAGAMNVHHQRKLKLNKSYDKAFDLCLASLTSIGAHKVRTAIRDQGKITANASISWKTWSDKITFQLRKIGENETEIELSSRPAIPTTLVDYGKNLENVERICDFLTNPQTE